MIVGRPVLHPIVTDNPYGATPPAPEGPVAGPGGNSTRRRSAGSDAALPPSL
jgi:hypothetical protein